LSAALQFGLAAHRNGQQVLQQGFALGLGVDLFQLLLHVADQHLVVVQRVQRRGGGLGTQAVLAPALG
jgi:hypothetical protein